MAEVYKQMVNADVSQQLYGRSPVLERLPTIIITVIGTLAASITIYLFVFKAKKIELQYEIIASNNVLDIKADITKLDILYDGVSLKKKSDNLRIINLKITNTGSESVLKNYYDSNDPLGFFVHNGKLVETPEILDASNSYLQNKLVLVDDSLGRVKFNPIIVEPKEYFILKVLILHQIDEDPEIVPAGKVAGIKEIYLTRSTSIKDKMPFLDRTFGGNFIIQIIRFIIYSLFFLLFVFIIAGISVSVSNLKAKHRRRSIISKFKACSDYKYRDSDELIFKRFENEGQDVLQQVYDFTENEKLLNDRYAFSIKKVNDLENIKRTRKLTSTEKTLYHSYKEKVALFDKMIFDGVISDEENRMHVNSQIHRTLGQFLEFVSHEHE